MAEDMDPVLKARQEAKRQRLKMINEGANPPKVRVTLKREDLRKVLRHPANNIPFPESGGSVEWPHDQFTRRRIRDGDVAIEERKKEERPRARQPSSTS